MITQTYPVPVVDVMFVRGMQAFRDGALPKSTWPPMFLQGWQFAGECSFYKACENEGYIPWSDVPASAGQPDYMREGWVGQ